MKIFYTDGSTRGKNQRGAENEGGFGVIIFDKDDEFTILDYVSQQVTSTTNNRMELEAILWALDYADKNYPDEECVIYSDSAYAVNMCNDWIFKWAANGWKNSKKQTVENLDLVQEIYSHLHQDFYHCSIEKVSGHSGEIGNELADALATGKGKIFSRLVEDFCLIDKKKEGLFVDNFIPF